MPSSCLDTTKADVSTLVLDMNDLGDSDTSPHPKTYISRNHIERLKDEINAYEIVNTSSYDINSIRVLMSKAIELGYKYHTKQIKLINQKKPGILRKMILSFKKEFESDSIEDLSPFCEDPDIVYVGEKHELNSRENKVEGVVGDVKEANVQEANKECAAQEVKQEIEQNEANDETNDVFNKNINDKSETYDDVPEYEENEIQVIDQKKNEKVNKKSGSTSNSIVKKSYFGRKCCKCVTVTGSTTATSLDKI